MENSANRKYKASFLRMLLLFYPFWLLFSFIAALTDTTVGSEGFIYLALSGLLIMNVPGLIAQLYYVMVDSSGLGVKASSTGDIRISWSTMMRVRPIRLLHFRYVRVYRSDSVKLLWLLLSVRDSKAFMQDIISNAPAGNPLRVYLETGELVERTVHQPQPVLPADEAAPEARAVLAEDDSAAGQAAGHNTAQEEKIKARLRLEGLIKNGASWFYCIAGLSLVNTLALLIGLDWNFVIGLAVTQIIDSLASVIAGDVSANIGFFIKAAAVFMDVLIAGVFVLFGFFAHRKHGWSFITGMVFYTLDGLLFLILQDYLAAGFHLLALYVMFRGYRASKLLH